MIALAAGALVRGEVPGARSWLGIALVLGGTAPFFASGLRRDRTARAAAAG